MARYKKGRLTQAKDPRLCQGCKRRLPLSMFEIRDVCRTVNGHEYWYQRYSSWCVDCEASTPEEDRTPQEHGRIHHLTEICPGMWRAFDYRGNVLGEGPGALEIYERLYHQELRTR